MKHFLGGLLATLALGGFAWAEGGGGSQRWDVNSSLLNKEEGCFYSVEGSAPGLPNGTTLHISLVTQGTGANKLRASFFKVVLDEGKFSGSFHWPNKAFAPLMYTTKVELFVGNQPPGVRRILMREFGYPANAREVVAEEEVPFGESDEQRVAFSVASLGEVTDFTARCHALHVLCKEIVTSEGEWLGRWQEEFMPPLTEFQSEMRKFENLFVIRRTSDLIVELRNIGVDLVETAKIIALEPGTDVVPRLGQLKSRLQTIDSEIESRLPLDTSVIEEEPEEGDTDSEDDGADQ